MSRTENVRTIGLGQPPPPAYRTRYLLALRRAFLLLLVVAASALVISRLAIYLTIQYPAPTGDGILFSSVALYHCTTGVFATPIFPLDPTGADRYVWHAIGHPALLSLLNLNCSNAGAFGALSVILLATFGVAGLAVIRARGVVVGLLFAVSVFALQAKQGFRPETTAILVVLAAELLRQRGQVAAWLVVSSVLAWVQPTTLILYGAYTVLSTSTRELRDMATTAKSWLPLLLVLHGLCVLAYPFPITDLLQGLMTQGSSFAKRSDGAIFIDLVRSDFFPLFGLAFLAVYVLAVRANWKLLGLLPLVWFYGLRVPPTYYNLVPLFGVLLFSMLLQRRGESHPGTTTASGFYAAVAFTAALATVGLLQSTTRDVGSHFRYQASLEAASARYASFVASGAVPCAVPPFFTLIQPRDFFESSHNQPTARACHGAVPGPRWDFLPATGAPPPTEPGRCVRWVVDPTAAPYTDAIARIFNSDAGYSFTACPRP